MQLDDLKGWMTGQDCVVVGCGDSSLLLEVSLPGAEVLDCYYGQRWTLPCNRSIEWARADFAVCIEESKDGIWDEIRPYLPLITFGYQPFSHRVPLPCSRLVKIDSKNVLEWLLPCETCKNTGKVDGGQGHIIECGSCHGRQPLSLNQCPFYAIALAVFMGFETIGVIGVDLTADRYGGAARPNKKYGALAEIAESMGSKLVNLSTSSQLTAIPQGSWEEIRRKCSSKTSAGG